MRSSFLTAFDGQWRRPISDYEVGVENYLVTLDTNVLLNLYRFTPQARKELLEVLDSLQDRLWISHQVAHEYYGRRLDAVKEHIALYTSVPKALDESKNKAIQELNTFAKRCSMLPNDRSKLLATIEDAFNSVTSEIQRYKDEFDLDIAKVATSDPVLEQLANILDGKTGAPFDKEDSDKLLESFKERVESETPPGYKDANKPENAHGDFFVWEQVLREAGTRNLPVLLVTNDQKEDWVLRGAGLPIGPRPELIAEFKERCGTDFLLTDLGTFLKIAKSKLGATVSESTVTQAENADLAESDRSLNSPRLSRQEYEELMLGLLAERRHWHHRTLEASIDGTARVAAVAARRHIEQLLTELHDAPFDRHPDGSISLEIGRDALNEIRSILEEGWAHREAGQASDLEASLRNGKLVRNKIAQLRRRLIHLKEQREEVANSLYGLGIEHDSAAMQDEGRSSKEVNAARESARAHLEKLTSEIYATESELEDSRFLLFSTDGQIEE